MSRRTAIIVLLVSLTAASAGAQESTLAPQAAAPAPVLSQSKFLGLLYAEIAKRIPEKNRLGAGEVKASYHVNPQGKIDRVVIEKASTPAHAELVKKILASVQGPPPPANGDPDISQTFKFH
jgi:hypothetical protein